MSDSRPNILLLVTDQQRGDCLGLDGHPVLQTPYLDAIGGEGAFFRRAYSACPICIPARRTLMSGRRPIGHGVLMNYDTDMPGPTLPGELARAGYQTHLVGKLHLHPKRKRYGFHSAEWADGPGGQLDSDYTRFLRQNCPRMHDPARAHGMDGNGFPARPWHLDESLHFTTWCADRALDYLERRDPTMPFFLKVSFFHPHTPCTPPPFYWDLYRGMDLPPPHVGAWAEEAAEAEGSAPSRGMPVNRQRVRLEPEILQQLMAGYFGCITHIDHQIGRILQAVPRDTVVVFTSDHGEMLGDHHWIRKSKPYEGSARIPFLMRFPASMEIPPHQVRDAPVELMDIMPTLLDAAGAPIPECVEGRSLLPLLRGTDTAWRACVHGECAHTGYVPGLPETGMQYLTDGRRKYIWYPGTGREQFFDLEIDPHEETDRAGEAQRREEVALWRERLVRELDGRPEGFTDGAALRRLDGPTAYCPAG